MAHKDSQGKDRNSGASVRANGSAMAHRLELDESQPKASDEARGSDPYNTSGSFDRKKHWERVGRR
jgi:hypothetical protein